MAEIYSYYTNLAENDSPNVEISQREWKTVHRRGKCITTDTTRGTLSFSKITREKACIAIVCDLSETAI